MILTDISGKIKGIPDISPNIFAILAIILALSGGYFGYSIIEGEYGREGSLRVISGGVATSSSATTGADESIEVKGKYVASRSGSFYYLPTCSGAKRIKEKNLIWLESREEAEARGLKPASGCQGM
jgi:hypothetical protein